MKNRKRSLVVLAVIGGFSVAQANVEDVESKKKIKISIIPTVLG